MNKKGQEEGISGLGFKKVVIYGLIVLSFILILMILMKIIKIGGI